MNNTDTIIRDLDLLGVQKEIDLTFIMEERGLWNTSDRIPIDIEESTYKDCLKHNDEHHIKIVSATIKHKATGSSIVLAGEYNNFYARTISIYSYDHIEMSFSNGVGLKFMSILNSPNLGNRYRSGKPIIYFTAGLEPRSFHLEIKDPLNESLYVLSSFDSNNALEPYQAKEYLRFDESKSCLYSFFEILEKYFMREGITEGILEELFL